MTPFRKASPWTRLPMSRPCMSVIATMIVSIRPSLTHCSSSARCGCLPGPCPFPVPWPPAPVACAGAWLSVMLAPPPWLANDDGPAEDSGRPVQCAPIACPVGSGAGELPSCVLELLLDLGELLGGALRSRATEASPGVAEEVHRQQDHERADDR